MTPPYDDGKLVTPDRRPFLGDQQIKIKDDIFQGPVQIGHFKRNWPASEHLRALLRTSRINADIRSADAPILASNSPSPGIDILAVALIQQGRECPDLPQRLLQIMRSDRCKLLQVFIGMLQRIIRLLKGRRFVLCTCFSNSAENTLQVILTLHRLP